MALRIAVHSDRRAAREAGRLLSMLRVDWGDDVGEPEVQTWPEEPFLRAAVRDDPDDPIAANLLAGRLVQQIAFWLNDADEGGEGEDPDMLHRRREEGERLYGRVLRDAPQNPAARYGVAMLGALCDGDSVDMLESCDRFSYYELSLSLGSGSFGHDEAIVATDLDELRWACDGLVKPWGDEPGGLDLWLWTYEAGESVGGVNLGESFDGAVHWDAVEVPALSGEPLPPGHGAQAGVVHYGYSCSWG